MTQVEPRPPKERYFSGGSTFFFGGGDATSNRGISYPLQSSSLTTPPFNSPNSLQRILADIYQNFMWIMQSFNWPIPVSTVLISMAFQSSMTSLHKPLDLGPWTLDLFLHLCHDWQPLAAINFYWNRQFGPKEVMTVRSMTHITKFKSVAASRYKSQFSPYILSCW